MEIKLEIGQNHPRKLTESSAKLHASLTKMLSVSVSHKVETSLITDLSRKGKSVF